MRRGEIVGICCAGIPSVVESLPKALEVRIHYERSEMAARLHELVGRREEGLQVHAVSSIVKDCYSKRHIEGKGERRCLFDDVDRACTEFCVS